MPSLARLQVPLQQNELSSRQRPTGGEEKRLGENREAFCKEHESKHNPTASTLCLRLSWQMLTLLKVRHRWRETTRQTHFMRQMSSLLLEWESKSKSEGADGSAHSFTASALHWITHTHTHSHWDREMENSRIISLPFETQRHFIAWGPGHFNLAVKHSLRRRNNNNCSKFSFDLKKLSQYCDLEIHWNKINSKY